MATISDLPIKPLSEMSKDEAIEYLRVLRLSRRTPTKVKSKATKNKISQSKASSKITKSDAASLLKLLGG